MACDAAELLVRADDLGEALRRAQQAMSADAFQRLLSECDALIRDITRVEYAAICARSRSEKQWSCEDHRVPDLSGTT